MDLSSIVSAKDKAAKRNYAGILQHYSYKSYF